MIPTNVCSYTEAWGSSYATNKGQYRGNDHYMIQYSYTFTNASNAGFDPKKGDTSGAVHQASVDIQYATLQPFCSSALGYSALLATVTPTTIVTPLATSTVFVTTTTTASINKRDLSTPAVLTKYPASIITSACSMLVSQATSTSTLTAPVSTIQTATQTTLETSVITVTASPIPSTCGNKGIQYAYYGGSQYTEGNNVNNVYPEDYSNRIPTWISATTKVGGIDISSGDSQAISLYGSNTQVSSQYFILNHRGYVSLA